MKSFTIFLLVFIAWVFPATLADIAFPDQRYLEAYVEPGCTGPVYVFFDYVPDLSVYLTNGAIASIRITGTWILYQGTYYFEDEDHFLRSGINKCEDMPFTSEYQASSLRYAGSPNAINDVYFNLYKGTYWGGAEFRSNTNALTVGPLDMNVSSLIITGQSPWTFFTGLEYSGMGVCVYPADHEEDGDIEYDYYRVAHITDIGLEDNSIRSVARGCLTKNVVRLPPSKNSSHLQSDLRAASNGH